MAEAMSVKELSEEVLKIAAEELNENPATRPAEIEKLRKRVLSTPELNICTDDAYLLRFLRAAAFDHEATFTLIMKYFTMKSAKKLQRFFGDVRPSLVKHVLEAGVSGVLPGRDKLGRRVMVFRPGKWDPSKYDIDDVFKANFMTLHKICQDEETQIRGLVVIYDMKGMGFGHLTHLTPFAALRFRKLIKDALPVRFRTIHFIDEPAVFDFIYAIIRRMLWEDATVILHGHKLHELLEYFDPEILPVDFGGTGPAYSNEKWMETLLSCEDLFEAEAKNVLLKDKNKGGKAKDGADSSK